LNVGNADKIRSVLKYNGNPFLPSEIHQQCKELTPVWQH
jgi:2-oxoglutarate ferredoxin oxidoreductase subunit alpha